VKPHATDMNVHDTGVKHHLVVVVLNAVDVDVNSIDVDITKIDRNLDTVKGDGDIADMDLSIGGAKLPLVDVKWHLEILPLPHGALQNAAGAYEVATLVVIIAALDVRVLEMSVDPAVFNALHQLVLVFTNFFQSAAGRVNQTPAVRVGGD